MIFYVTTEPCRKLKNMFSNLSSFYIIDVDSILEMSKLDPTKLSHQYLINSELKRLILSGAKSKRYSGMIYINSNIDKSSVESIRCTLDEMENSFVENVVILDDYDIPKLKKLYKMFDEVVFFNTVKTPKIIKCVPNESSKQIKSNGKTQETDSQSR